MIAPETQTRLGAWLAREAGAERVALETIAALGGGAISQNIAVDLVIEGGPLAGRHDCVLRAASPAGVAASLTKPQEFAVLRAGVAAGMTAPEPLFACDDPAVFGRPFYIMRRARGIAAGRLITRSEAPQAELARELGRQLALLHTIKPGAPGLGFLPVPESPGLAAARLYRQWLGPEAGRDPVIAWGLRWLERNAPPPAEIVLCHHDFRTGNYLVEEGRLTAILDWEFCGWSDPMEDVAWFCCRSWRFARPDLEAGGVGSRADFYAAYEEASGRRIDPARIAFWEISAYLRWAAIAWLQAERHTSGVEPSLELALTGRMMPEILGDMLIHLESLEQFPITPVPARAGMDTSIRGSGAEGTPMRLTPDAHNLLAAALDAFRAEVLPSVPTEKRYAALMVVSALAMTERELAGSPQESAAELEALYTDVADIAEGELERRFAADIEAGRFDETSPRGDAAFAAIKAMNAGRLAITNPKRLR